MRLGLLAVILCAVPAALCQTPQPGLLNPAQPQPTPPAFQFPGNDYSNKPPTWQSSHVSATHILSLPRMRVPPPPVGPEIDPDIIIHPPKSRMGDEPQGSLVAQNIYPGLRWLPINNGKPIPNTWPKAKIEFIPITWPESQLLPIDTDSPTTRTAPAK